MTTVDWCIPSDIQDSGLLLISNRVTWPTTYSRRSGGRCLLVQSSYGNHGYANLLIPGASASKTVRFALWLPSNHYINDSYIAFREGSTIHVKLLFDPVLGKLKIMNGDGSTIQDWTSGFTPGACNLYEVKLTIHDSTGSIEIKWQNSTLLTLTDQDTRNGGTPILDNFRVQGYGPSSSDLYVWLDDYACADDWIGPGTLIVKPPTADGSDTGWTASTGNKWACVDEIPPAATDYIYADGGAGGTKQSFDHGALAVSPSHIGFVAAIAKVRLNEAGSGMARVTLLATDDYTNGADVALSTTAAFTQAIATINPHTSAEWDKAGADAAEPGVETRV